MSDHPHHHGHSHDSHDHGGDHGHGPRYLTDSAPASLERGAGKGKILFFDCFSGVAGDMSIAAMVDLGVPSDVIVQSLQKLPVGDYELVWGSAHRSGIVARTLDVVVSGKQPVRTYGEIDQMLVDAELDSASRDLARAIFLRLGESESAVHKMPLKDVHFHEVGAVDAIVDIVGAATALSYLEADVVVSPLPMGRGFVKAAHGILPLPAPATVNCLRGLATYGVEEDFEFVTPTGAAIVGAAASRSSRWPSMSPERVGFGAGHKDLASRPNMLRVVLGARSAPQVDETASHVVIEANVDDMSGELSAHAVTALFDAGALDAWVAPITMKKGRPGLVVSALCPSNMREAITAVLLRETSSIGARHTPVSRTERPRRMARVDTVYGPIRIKISEGPYGPAQVKPEFDDCAAAALRHGVPARIVVVAALTAARTEGSVGTLDG